MKTIQEIIKQLNWLEDHAKEIPQSTWLYEIGKWEDLFSNHPEVDNTCCYNNRWVMKSDVTLKQLGY